MAITSVSHSGGWHFVYLPFRTAFDFFFGCHHGNLSRVFTIEGHSYRVCCACCAKFEYSLETMSIRRREFSPLAAAPCHVIRLRSRPATTLADPASPADSRGKLSRGFILPTL
jgi:hypothetical protein